MVDYTFFISIIVTILISYILARLESYNSKISKLYAHYEELKAKLHELREKFEELKQRYEYLNHLTTKISEDIQNIYKVLTILNMKVFKSHEGSDNHGVDS